MLFKLCILKRLCILKAQYIVFYCGHREKIMKHDILKSLLNISKFHGHLHKAPHSEGPYSQFPISNWHPCSHITCISRGSQGFYLLYFFFYIHIVQIFLVKLCNYPTITTIQFQNILITSKIGLLYIYFQLFSTSSPGIGNHSSVVCLYIFFFSRHF